ncbi:MAG: TolC family protein [Bacteroidales bacterium]|nr:TolC family protein [Bacteroidales bacterium]MDD4384088.1 TolC family protein [Bacteroidales bacterium]MDY0197221.1 TolC family protein [Tenuifilaceae bacterium]
MIKYKTFIVGLCLAFFSLNAHSQSQALSLEQCKELALEHNYGVRVANEQVGATDALSKSVRTNFFPNIAANAAYTRVNKQFSLFDGDKFIPVVPFSSINPETGEFNPNLDPVNTFVFNPISGDMLYDKDGNPVFQNYAWLPSDQFQLGAKNIFVGGISLTQPIYTGGKIREAYRISQFGNQIAKANLTKEQDEVLYTTEENYWRIVALKEKVEMVESYMSLLEKLSFDLDNLYQEGIILKNDILRVRVKHNEAKLNLQKVQNGLTLSHMALCQITGLPLNTDLILTDSLSNSITILPEMAYGDTALVFRPELDALSQTVGIAQSAVKIAQSRYLPNIGLTASYMLLNPNPYKGFDNSFGGDWSVGVAMNIPIFHWNDKAHTLRAARHEQSAAELKLNEARELILLQVQKAVFTANESTKKVALSKENLKIAEENLRIATDAFAEGMVKTTDVLEAQALWFDAYSSLIDGQMENQLSVVNLKKVMGKSDYK